MTHPQVPYPSSEYRWRTYIISLYRQRNFGNEALILSSVATLGLALEAGEQVAAEASGFWGSLHLKRYAVAILNWRFSSRCSVVSLLVKGCAFRHGFHFDIGLMFIGLGAR